MFATIAQIRLFPETASVLAGRVDLLFWFLTGMSVLITLLVLAMVVYFGLRYRRRTEDEVPAEDQPQPFTEIGWSVVLFVVFMVMFFWGARLYIDSRRAPEHALVINVVGKQWMWKMQHPGGQREINELHVPIGRPVKLVMTSQDVIHSFSVPAFRIKQDVLPGSYTTQWFTADKLGAFHLFCQEYCGTNHSQMIGRVVVMDPREYDAWLAGVPVDNSAAVAGAKLFVSYGCAQCHGQTAPTLAGLYGRNVLLDDGTTVLADEQYLRDSIVNPAAQVVAGYGRLMPSFRRQLTDEQVDALIQYMKSLGASRADDVAASANRTDVAAPPSTSPANALPPSEIPNIPPSRQSPGAGGSQ